MIYPLKKNIGGITYQKNCNTKVFDSPYLLNYFPILHTHQTGFTQIGYWILYGPNLVYLTSKNVLDKKKRSHFSNIIGAIVGFFIWIVVLLIEDILNLEVYHFTNMAGGFFRMALFQYAIKKIWIK
ncbi:hypothetical protein HNV12_12320 [Methanococcoides sp. SA1]|nr:hypothetical protein [Methanococcoides sp. SA1]